MMMIMIMIIMMMMSKKTMKRKQEKNDGYWVGLKSVFNLINFEKFNPWPFNNFNVTTVCSGKFEPSVSEVWLGIYIFDVVQYSKRLY